MKENPRHVARRRGDERYSGPTCRACAETWRYTKTGRCVACAHARRQQSAPLHYDGAPCRACGRTLRYTRSRHCVHCTRRLCRASKGRQSVYALGRPGRVYPCVLNALRAAEGGIASMGELIEAVWPHPDNEPEWAENVIRRAVFELRELGYPIKTHHTRGYSYAPAFKEVSANVPGTQWGVDATLRQVILSP